MTTLAQEHSDLLSLAVHEFRTPLTVVAGYTKMLTKEQLGPLSEGQRKALQEVEQQCTRLSKLLQEMSALADLVDPQAPPLPQEEIALTALLEEATTGGVDAADKQSVSVVPTSPAGRVVIRGDRKRLASALASVIRAVVREQGGAGRVLIEAAPRQQDGRAVAVVAIGREGALDVSPNGGPDARFNEYPGGIGLGLPIARRVIEQAGGRVWSSSEGRQLGVVTVLLPLKESHS
jgi:signal transduction histidine kinase